MFKYLLLILYAISWPLLVIAPAKLARSIFSGTDLDETPLTRMGYIHAVFLLVAALIYNLDLLYTFYQLFAFDKVRSVTRVLSTFYLTTLLVLAAYSVQYYLKFKTL